MQEARELIKEPPYHQIDDWLDEELMRIQTMIINHEDSIAPQKQGGVELHDH